MKNKTELKKIFAMTVAAATLFSATAIAAQSDNKGLISPSPTTASSEDTKVNAEMKYQLVKGKIESVAQKDGYTTISVANDDMGMVFNASDDVFVIDQKDGSYKKLADLKEGMEITALLNNNSPMTMSIPPMTSGAEGFIIQAEGGSIDLSIYNDELTNAENTLKLNIGDTTTITDIRGAKKIFTEEDLKGCELLVLYGASTRSIPAQTNPDLVMIVNNEEMSAEVNEPLAPGDDILSADEAPVEAAAPVATEPFTLRSAAEQAGFTVTWTANDKPVVLEKGDVKIELTLGQKAIMVNSQAQELSAVPVLVDGAMVVPADFSDLLK